MDRSGMVSLNPPSANSYVSDSDFSSPSIRVRTSREPSSNTQLEGGSGVRIPLSSQSRHSIALTY